MACKIWVRVLVTTMVLLASLPFLSACGHPPPSYPYEKEPNPLTQEYVIGPADDVQIRVYKHDEFSTGQGVRPDGYITIPLVGDIRAAGLTPSQLELEVKQKVAAFVKGEPEVTVAVTGINSYFVTVTGRVAGPGRFQSATYLTVVEAISLAGGPTTFASPEDSFVLRRGPDGKVKRIPFNYEQVIHGEYLQQNIYLLRGDQVVVP
jgi:polysaccharide export outer membrane protein